MIVFALMIAVSLVAHSVRCHRLGRLCRINACDLELRAISVFSPRDGTEGAEPGSGVQRFLGPLRGIRPTPRFSKSGSRTPPLRGPLEAQKGSQRPQGGSSGALERGVRFRRSGKRKWASQRPKRSRFPGCPLRGVPTSASNPRATDNLLIFF